MNATEIKNRLEAILAKINDNTAELWADDIETTYLCVKLEGGWKSDLLTLVAELDRESEKERYVIFDKTANTGKPYIADDFSNTGDITSAWIFNSESEAQKIIDDSGFGWAYVEKVN